ncbi:hypothetical protein [Aeromicrobium sp. CF3.5]|uniref:hypothetical protein n=1 Tax=Aeromicrobium sp. CF3.5 TaxID=3373078 RepID=UPI003EE516DF
MTPNLMPASTTHPTTTTDGSRREGVRTMFKLSRNSERKRAWDELSATDRAVLVEVVRQRREEQELQRADLQARNAARHIR